MALDPGTLVTVLLVVCGVIACLLALTWIQNRGVPTLGTWAICFLLFAATAGIVAARRAVPEFAAVDAANTLRLLAYGLCWQATRHFFGRKGSWVVIFGPAALWAAGASSSLFGEDYRLRLLLSAPLVAAFTFAIVAELLHATSKGHRFQRLIALVLTLHGTAYVARFLVALFWPYASLIGTAAHPLSPIGLLEGLAVAVALAPLLVSAAKEQVVGQYQRAALIDPLTGVSNRRGFEAEMRRMLARGRRDGSSTALLLLDLDHFKAVNDGWGHMAGDQALRRFTGAVTAELRAGDLIGRLGGEEFAVTLADCRADQALELAERIRRRVAALAIREGEAEIRMTVSIGVASLRGAESPDALLSEADAALYRAKAGGRDRVNLAPECLPLAGEASTHAVIRRVA